MFSVKQDLRRELYRIDHLDDLGADHVLQSKYIWHGHFGIILDSMGGIYTAYRIWMGHYWYPVLSDSFIHEDSTNIISYLWHEYSRYEKTIKGKYNGINT